MINVKVHTLIAPDMSGWLYSIDDGAAGAFSLDFVQHLFEEHPDEKDFRFNINCPGGDVAEGFAIYDFLRTSGKNIYMNIEGACHSMAVTLLLAAPKENRTANPNSRALIHKPWIECVGGTADDLATAEENMRQLQVQMLNIYADRTDLTYEEAERIMGEEQFHSAEELLKWGFISKINPYTNNKLNPKNKTMNALLEKITNFLTSLKAEVNEATEEVKNYVFYGEDGVELFRTEREDDYLEVGMKAEPDGVFEIGDRVIVIEGGVITEIRNERERDEAVDALRAELEAMTAERDAANAERDALIAERDTLRDQLNNATTLLNEAKAQIKSTGKIGNRIGAPEPTPQPKNSDERKAAIKAKLKK